jgi:hypothetical protein
MAYEEFARLLEANQTRIAREVAQEVLDRKLSPTNPTLEEFIKVIGEPLKLLIRYLATGDITEITNYSQDYIKSRFEKGVTIESMTQVNEVFFSKLRGLIDQELPGPENEKVRSTYHRRLDGIKTLSNVTALSTSLKKDLNL